MSSVLLSEGGFQVVYSLGLCTTYVVLVLRCCQSPIRTWLVNYLHLHLHSHSCSPRPAGPDPAGQ